MSPGDRHLVASYSEAPPTAGRRVHQRVVVVVVVVVVVLVVAAVGDP